MKHTLLVIIAIGITACSGNQSTNTDNQADTIGIVASDSTTKISEPVDESEVVINRVKEIYDHVLRYDFKDVDSYWSEEYKALCAEGDLLAKGDVWGADCDFWTMTQDPGEGSELANAEVLRMNIYKAVVKCDINIRYSDQITPVCCVLELIKENGIWVADDCMNEDETFSMKQAAIDDINEMKK